MPKLDGRPFVISEYGGYSMILDGHVWNKQKSFGYIMFRSKEKLSAAYKMLVLRRHLKKLRLMKNSLTTRPFMNSLR